MQKAVFLLLFIIFRTNSFSQQEFFLYFQADNHQPFYARINTRMYSSTENGYMIIPKLGDSIYEVVIGFAKNAFPEQSFQVSINNKDRGFQLKNLGEKGWSLVDLQNMSVIMNTGLPAKAIPEFAGIKKTDAFSEMLADVVNDSAILYSAVKPKPSESTTQKTAVIENKQPEKEKHEAEPLPATVVMQPPSIKKEPDEKKDSVSVSANDLNGITAIPKHEAPKELIPKTIDNYNTAAAKNTDTGKSINEVIAGKASQEKPFITRVEEKKTNELYQATYLEQYIYKTDTIKITISLTDPPAAGISSSTPADEKKAEPALEQKNVSQETTAAPKPAVVDTAASKNVVQITNSDCINLATDYDVDKLRVRLISDKTIDDKLATAKKYFKTKCLSVKQIKALTELFPSDETKYRFFDTSYPYVSDTGNFYQLEELIENNYYKNRFKAMIQK